MANLLSTSVSGSLSSTGRITTTYNTDRYQFNLSRTSGSNWWFTNDSDKLGLHIDSVGDKFYFGTGGDFWSSANGWLSTALSNRAPKAYITDSYVEFTIEGDANTYYPVTIHNWNGVYSWQRYSIHRSYSDPAPWDPIGTGVHRGGLTFAFEWAGDIAWGGNDKSIRVIEFNETYTQMVTGLQLAHCEGVVVWLRGGGAYYRLHGPGGRSQSYTINMSTWTSCAGVQYSPMSYDSGRVNSQINNRYPIRNNGEIIYAESFVDINDANYNVNPNGTSNFLTANILNTYVGNAIYFGGANNYFNWDGARINSNVGIQSASDFRAPIFYDSQDTGFYVDPNSNSRLSQVYVDNLYNYGWFRNYGNQGIYNQDYGTHFYSNAGNTWVVTGSGGTVSLEFRSNHQSTLRGYVYADTSNNIGFLNNAGNWSLRTDSSRNTEIYGSLQVNSGTSFSGNTSWFGGYGGGSGPGIALENLSTFARFAFWGLDFYDWNHGIQMTIDNGYVSAANSFRAPIFYDSNDTTYYLDPNSSGTSLNVRGEIRNPSVWINDGDNYNDYNENIRLFNAPNGVSVIAFSASGTGGTPTTSILGFSDRLETRVGGTWEQRIYGGYVEARGSFRAPIFYDSNDTNYYLDPASDLSLKVYGEICNSNYQPGRLQPGALNIGRTDTNYAWDGGTWADDVRLGILANTNETWEFGIHDSGDSVMSVVHFDGGSTLTMGRNLGWGQCVVNAPAGYVSNGNAWGTNNSAFFPNGITTAGGTNWIYGFTYIGNAPGNGNGHEFNANGTQYSTASITTPTFIVNSHSDNTRGYRIHNTSGTAVSAMFVNSSNQLVIAAGAVDQVNLNKKVYVNGVALGVNVAPSATAGRIDASNDIVAYSTSDERFKENITPISNALDKVKTLTGVEFDWRKETKDYHGYVGHDVGVIAQQVKAVLPEAVRTNANGYLAVRYEKLIGLLIEGMKEQQAQIDELKAKLDGLTK